MRYGVFAAGFAACALIGASAELKAQNTATGFEPSPTQAITQVGTRGANFLRIGPDARARALGDAGVMLNGSAATLFYNVAGAAHIEGISATASFTDLYAGSGLQQTFVGLVLPAGQGAIGLHAVSFGSGDIEPTSEFSPAGADPQLGPSFEWRSIAVGASYARRITDRLSFGATGKYIQEGIDFAKVQWYGLDVGTVFETGVYGVRLAMAINNIGGESRFEGPAIYSAIDRQHRVFPDKILGSTMHVRYDTEEMQLPTTFRMGVSSQVFGGPASVLGGAGGAHSIMLLTELSDGFDSPVESRWGAEYGFREMFFVRGGMQVRNEDRAPWDLADGLTAGAGLRLPILSRHLGLDYAYTSMGVLDNVQTFSLRIGS